MSDSTSDSTSTATIASATPETATEIKTVTADAPKATWKDLGLSDVALDLLAKAGFTAPTKIQAESIPLSLAGHDVIASAETGSGKTASFILPLCEKFAGKEGTFALILAPTREIAQQTQTTIDLFGKPRGLRSAILIGGIDMRFDKQALDTYPQIIIATPGRLGDHLDRGNIWLDFIQLVILDEADRMLDMGFSDQLNRIMEEVPETTQTLVFSATFPHTVERLAQKILRDPKRVAIGKPTNSNSAIEQKLIWMDEASKNRELRRILRDEPGKIIIFTRSKDAASRLWRTLHSQGIYDATYISSDRQQTHREQALAQFKDGTFRILIATDVAGRGIHVDAVAHVINYELPMEPEDYIHRIGRTGRQGATGKSTTFATRRDRGIMRDIEKLLNLKISASYLDGMDENGGGGDESRGGSDRGGRSSRGGGGRGGNGQSRGASSPSRVGAPAAPGGPINTGGAREPREGRGGRQQRSPETRNLPAKGHAAPVQAFGSAEVEEARNGGAHSTHHSPTSMTAEGGQPAKRKRRRGGRGRNKGGAGGGEGRGPVSDGGGTPPAAT